MVTHGLADRQTEQQKEKFKRIVKERIREQARQYLIKLKQSHTKSRQLDENFNLQPYIKSNTMSKEETQLLLRFRTYTYDCKENYRWNNTDIKCSTCKLDETQEHLIHCTQFTDITKQLPQSIKYEHIFGKLSEQIKIIKVLMLIDQRRSIKSKSSSTTGSQVHLLGASCTSSEYDIG